MGQIKHTDCMVGFKELKSNSVDLTLTDIPYDGVNRDDGGLRTLDKGKADIITFDLEEFLKQVDRVTKGTIIIFCGMGQISTIYNYFAEKKGTVRLLIWEKNNPSPMNGQHIYLSGIETAVWFKKSGSTFNAKCKNTVFRHNSGMSKEHPTEKPTKLLQELIMDNSKPGDLVFDPCFGSGSTLESAKRTGRDYLGFELNEQYFNIGKKRLEKNTLF